MTDKDTISLGPFELHHRIARGQVADVWIGRHDPQNVPVAVKVITPEKARQPECLLAFRHEVQAVARLDHPGIIMVLDHGEVSVEVEQKSEGELVAGSPYLVMEYAGQGTLARLHPPLFWQDLEALLLFLLDALAHSHARGVIHRDLKPGNVLFSGLDDMRPGPKLTDFGIAYAFDSQTPGELTRDSTGSPGYMAPEQWLQRWREYGPWTDLYTLGCMAYQLASGRMPFEGDSEAALGQAHMYQKPPQLKIPRGYPKGFAAWVEKLLEKSIRHRFQRAADATACLLTLTDSGETRLSAMNVSSEADLPSSKGRRKRKLDSITQANTLLSQLREEGYLEGPTLVFEPETITQLKAAAEEAKIAPHREPSHPVPKLRVPASWRRRKVRDEPLLLRGAGLGLFGMRPIPLVNRREELDKLWESLVQTVDLGMPRLVMVHGPAGCGKTRLLEWMVERAHELGVATVLRAIHTPIAGPGSGFPRMIARFFNSLGQPRAELLERIRQFFVERGSADEYDWNALTELTSPTSDDEVVDDRQVVRFGEPVQRYSILRRFLFALASERPVIIWLGDVHWGSETIGFAEHIITEPVGQPFPVLFFLTTRDEALSTRLTESEQLRTLMKRSRTRPLALGPLAERHHRQLVRQLLCLRDELAAEVERRTAGNPLFAVQLVGDWVHRGILELGPQGFQLQEGETAELPDDIHMLWTARFDRAIEEYATSGGVIPGMFPQMASQRPRTGELVPDQQVLKKYSQAAMELAAILGVVVDVREWKQACNEAEIQIPPRLIDYLVFARLVVPVNPNWRFIHGMLCESLERMARESGRLESYHRACAAMLGTLYPKYARGVSERLGQHLYAAGQLQEALEPLLKGCYERTRRKEYIHAFSLIEQIEGVLTTLDTSPQDPKWARVWLMRARFMTDQEALDGAEMYSSRAEEIGRQSGSALLEAEAIQLRARVLRIRGQLQSAIWLLSNALTLFRKANDPYLLSRCIYHYALALAPTGNLDQTWSLLHEAQALAIENQDHQTIADCQRAMANLALERRDLERSCVFISEAMRIYLQEGNFHALASSHVVLGEIQRLQGNLDLAQENYRKALETLEQLGLVNETHTPQVNLLLISLHKGHYEQALSAGVKLAQTLTDSGTGDLLGCINCICLAAAAGVPDWAAWETHLEQVKAMLDQPGMVERDNAWSLQLAGDLARQHERWEQALLVYPLARALWAKLGAKDRVKQLENCIASCREEEK